MKEDMGSLYTRLHENRTATRQRHVPPASPARAGHYVGLHPEDRPDDDDEIADDLTVADEDEWYPRMPKSALRLRDTREEPDAPTTSLSRQKTQTAVITKRHTVPARSSAYRTPETDELPVARPRLRLHWLVVVGLALLVMIGGYVLFTILMNWWTTTTNTWAYGYPRTYQCDTVVGHDHDSTTNPTHFIALNLNGKVEVIELPAGDGSKAKIYIGPSLVGTNANLAPITLSFADVNGDGKLDMLIHVQGGTFVFVNTGTEFRPATPADHVSVPNP